MSFKQFNIDDYNRIRQTADLARRVEGDKAKKKPRYLEKLSDERRTELERIYGAKKDESKVSAVKHEKAIQPKTFFKRTTRLALPRRTWPFRMERNRKNNMKLHDKKMSELKIDPNKKIRTESANYVKSLDHKKYETFKFTNLLYVPTRDLPYGGWIQRCVFCNYETTCLQQVDDYKLYCCNKCNRKHSMYQKRQVCSEVLKYLARLGY